MLTCVIAVTIVLQYRRAWLEKLIPLLGDSLGEKSATSDLNDTGLSYGDAIALSLSSSTSSESFPAILWSSLLLLVEAPIIPVRLKNEC